ncbi:MAG: sugar phosphate isomerase/epimerase [Bryobacterales bacterium]|nr:sugar phosphate isomerase/epimerase [Bryobacterales bacterium]
MTYTTRRSALAASLGALCRTSSAASPLWRLSASSVLFRRLPVEGACEAIAKAGYSAVDFWPDTFECTHLNEIEKRLGPSGLRDLLARYQLKLSAFTAYRQASSARYGELLGQCGGGVMVRDSQYGQFPNRRQSMVDFLDSLKPELEAARKYGYSLAIENHGKALLETLESIRIFVELAGHSNLGIALAPYHLQAGGESVEDAIRIAGDKLIFVYGWQKAEKLNQLPGFGPCDFAFLKTLTEIGYTGYVNAFMHGDEPYDVMLNALTHSRKFLSRVAGPV